MRFAVVFMWMSMSSCRSRICRFCFLIISFSSAISTMSWWFSCLRSRARRKVSATPPGPNSSSYFFCSFSKTLMSRLYLISKESVKNSISFFSATTARSRARIEMRRSRSLSSQHCRARSNCTRACVSSASTSALARSMRAVCTRKSPMRRSSRLRKLSSSASKPWRSSASRARSSSASFSSSSIRARSSSRSIVRIRNSSVCSLSSRPTVSSRLLIVANAAAVRSLSSRIWPSAKAS
mmetsp:Transcript_10695/g.25150  ORF Transcript_10695/g.25150 Transcript_10695/m.25150 type:complete len:238 (+) Transcript_10695:1466-2179(+)